MTCAHVWPAELKPETTCPRCGLTWADWSEEDDMSEKEWWVYVRNGARRAFPVGPFTSREQADAWVGPTSRYAEEHVDALAEWGHLLDGECTSVEVGDALVPVETVEAYGLSIRLDANGDASEISSRAGLVVVA